MITALELQLMITVDNTERNEPVVMDFYSIQRLFTLSVSPCVRYSISQAQQ